MILKELLDTHRKTVNGKSYVEAVTKENKPILKVPNIVVKPKKTQSSVTTKIEIQKKINPAEINVGISQLKETQNGSIVIKCNKMGDVDNLITSINKNLCDNYVYKQELKKPNIKIIGINEEYSKEQLERMIQQQNDISDEQITVKYIGQNRRNNTFTAFLDVSAATFSKFTKTGKVLIGWQRCWCYEELGLNRCMKCKRYRHNANKCNNGQVCGHCGGEHKDEDCKSNYIIA